MCNTKKLIFFVKTIQYEYKYIVVYMVVLDKLIGTYYTQGILQ